MTPLALANGHVSMGSKILNNGFIFYITGVLGSTGILLLGHLLQNCSFLIYCGKNSFYIMSVHYVIKATYLSFVDITGIGDYNEQILLQTIFPFILVLSLTLLFTLTYTKIKNTILQKHFISSNSAQK